MIDTGDGLPHLTAPAPPSSAALATVGAAPPQIGVHPRQLDPDPGGISQRRAAMRYQSPLRYPGAKSRLSKPLSSLLEHAQESSALRHTQLLVEPFVGGASVSLRMVGTGTAQRVLLADADPLVAQFWQVAAAETDRLIERMYQEPVTLERWDQWRAWTPQPGMSQASARFESAVKCLFLNRTTFSGILHGRAGPLGGRTQESDYGIGCRFNKDTIADRLRYVGELYDANRIVDVWCKDWQETLRDVPEWYPQLIPNQVVAYLDPPYLDKSRKLYQTSFDSQSGDARMPGTGCDTNAGMAPSSTGSLNWASSREHFRLAEYVRSKMRYRWIMSYDHHPALLTDENLYAANAMTPSRQDRERVGVRCWRISKRAVTLGYSISAEAERDCAPELLLTTLPPAFVLADDNFQPLAS